MTQDTSAGEAVRELILARGLVDLGLEVVTLALFLFVTLFAVSGAVYWPWWLIRLSRPANITKFTIKEIPGLRKGKAAGMEFEFGEVARAESDTIRVMGLTIEELSFRIAAAESGIQKLEGTFERFEDVSGRA